MEKETGRIEAFSDGIFGVAITLLAIEIGISEYQDPTNRNLFEKIIEKWPEYFAYFNSFATVLLIWMGHHQLFNRIRKASHSVLLLNGLVLLFVVLFPYPTRTVGIFIGTPAVNTAVAFYAAFTGLIVLSMLCLNLGILRTPQYIIDADKNIKWLINLKRGQLLAITLYFIAACIAFFQPTIALLITFGMWVYWAIVTKDPLAEHPES